MDIVSHFLIGNLIGHLAQPRTRQRGLIAGFWALAPDIPQAAVYLLLGRESGREYWIPHNSDWDGVRAAHPLWSMLWEIPHSFLILPIVAFLASRTTQHWRIATVAWLSHILTDIISHTGEWSVKPLYPISWMVEGFTDVWAWPISWMAISWVVLGGMTVATVRSNGLGGSVVVELEPKWLTTSRQWLNRPLRDRRLDFSRPRKPPEEVLAVEDELPPDTEATLKGIEIAQMWHDQYQSILKALIAVSGGILGLTTTWLLADDSRKLLQPWTGGTFSACLKWSMTWFGVSLIFALLARVATYNWLASGFGEIAYLKVRMTPALREEFSAYRGSFLGMERWGRLSYFLGFCAGVSALLGICLYMYVAIVAVDARVLSGEPI